MSDDGCDDCEDSHYSEPKPSYHEPSPEPSYHQSSPEPSYHHPSPEPSYHEPSIREPSPEPSYREPSYHEPSIRASSFEDSSIDKPSIRDPSIGEPSTRDLSVHEPSVHPQSGHDSNDHNSHHDPPAHHPQAQPLSHEYYTPSEATEQYHYSYNSASYNDSTRRISHDRQSRQSDHSHYFGGDAGYRAGKISGDLDQEQLRLQVIALLYPTSRNCLSRDSGSRTSSVRGDGQSGAGADPEGYNRDYSWVGNLHGSENGHSDDRRSEDGDLDIQLENYEPTSIRNPVVTHGRSTATHAIQRHGGNYHGNRNRNRPTKRPGQKEQHHQERHHHASNLQPSSIGFCNSPYSTLVYPTNSAPTQALRKSTPPTPLMVSKVISPYYPTATQIQELDTPSSMDTTAVKSVQRSAKYKRERWALCVRVCAVVMLLVCVALVIVLPIVYTRKS